MTTVHPLFVVERHGEPVGFFVPITAKDRRVGREALGRLGDLLVEVAARSGLNENDVAQEVTTRRRTRR